MTDTRTCPDCGTPYTPACPACRWATKTQGGVESPAAREDAARLEGFTDLLDLLGSLGLEPEWCNLSTEPPRQPPTEGPAHQKLLALADRLAAGLERLGWTRDRDALVAQGFADCESLLMLMLKGREDAERAIGTHSLASEWYEARVDLLLELQSAVSVGQHRTDVYDPEQITAAHRRIVNRSQASAGGKAAAKKLTPAERKQRGKDAVEARWAKVKKEKGESE